jgi:hypothetical protein
MYSVLVLPVSVLPSTTIECVSNVHDDFTSKSGDTSVPGKHVSKPPTSGPPGVTQVPPRIVPDVVIEAAVFESALV